VRGENDKIESKGARVVFIGNGTPTMAAAFREDFDVRSPLYTDPTLGVYKAAGLQRGFGSILKLLGNVPRALFKGHFQGLTKGDGPQQGGVLVIDAGGSVRYRFVSETAGHHPDLADVIVQIPEPAPKAS
jgi:AhpC/TSA antioxidant enzyme